MSRAIDSTDGSGLRPVLQGGSADERGRHGACTHGELEAGHVHSVGRVL